jgi:hypothetical protein
MPAVPYLVLDQINMQCDENNCTTGAAFIHNSAALHDNRCIPVLAETS